MLQALGNKIAVKRLKTLKEKENDFLKSLVGTEDYNMAGLYDDSSEEKFEGEVISAGDEVKNVSAGDKVIFNQWGEPDQVTSGGEKVYIISEYSVLGKEV